MKIAIVTGANGGIGFHTALQLAKDGSQVVLACRDHSRGTEALRRILDIVPDAKVELSILDLSSLNSIRNFCSRFVESKPKLDLLVNNAAVMALPSRTLSKDGFEMQFATNHLGHFLLTAELLPALTKADAPRVVTVSSIAHRYGKIVLDDLNAERSYEGWAAYGNSKLANLLFSFELARRTKAAGLPVLSVAAHPGVAKTNILASGPQQGRKVLRTYISEIFASLLAQTDAEGALPIIYASTNSSVSNGDYYGPNGFMEIRGMPTRVSAKPHALDVEMAQKLWKASEGMTGARFLPA